MNRAIMCFARSMAAVILAGCVTKPPTTVPEEGDGICPDLSGHYRMIAPYSTKEGTTGKAYLADYLAKSTEVRFDEIGRQVDRPRSFVTVQIDNIGPERVLVRNIADTGRILATYELGREHGWRCSEGRFRRRFRGEQYASESGGGQMTTEGTLSRAPDGFLEVSRTFRFQPIGVLDLGGLLATERASTFVYRFEPVAD